MSTLPQCAGRWRRSTATHQNNDQCKEKDNAERQHNVVAAVDLACVDERKDHGQLPPGRASRIAARPRRHECPAQPPGRPWEGARCRTSTPRKSRKPTEYWMTLSCCCVRPECNRRRSGNLAAPRSQRLRLQRGRIPVASPRRRGGRPFSGAEALGARVGTPPGSRIGRPKRLPPALALGGGLRQHTGGGCK